MTGGNVISLSHLPFTTSPHAQRQTPAVVEPEERTFSRPSEPKNVQGEGEVGGDHTREKVKQGPRKR